MALYETTKLQALSPSLRDLAPITDDLVGKWLAYWKAKGFISA